MNKGLWYVMIFLVGGLAVLAVWGFFGVKSLEKQQKEMIQIITELIKDDPNACDCKYCGKRFVGYNHKCKSEDILKKVEDDRWGFSYLPSPSTILFCMPKNPKPELKGTPGITTNKDGKILIPKSGKSGVKAVIKDYTGYGKIGKVFTAKFRVKTIETPPEGECSVILEEIK